MKRIVISCFVASCFMFLNAALAFAQTQNTQGKLQITIDQFKDDQGQALVLLYRPNDKLFKDGAAFKIITAKIVKGQATVIIEDLPFGEYAAVAIHDENSNNKVDRHWYGHPKEPFGFSNDAPLPGIPGMLKFQELAFTFSATQTTSTIHLFK